MSSSRHALHIAVLAYLLARGSNVEANIVLTHVPVDVKENSSAILSCYGTSTAINGIMYWILNYSKLYRVNLLDNPCRALDYPLNRTDIYTIHCDETNTSALTIINVDRLQHGDTWQCRIGFQFSNVVTMYVKVPVSTLDISFTDEDFIEENQTSRFQCKSSFSRPKPEIYWFFNNRTTDFHDDERLNSNITETLVNETVTVSSRTYTLTSTESKLELKVQRFMNNQQIYCLTNDTSGTVLRSTMEILNISYPPDGPPYILDLIHNATYSIINKFKGNMSCIVTGGNPRPILNWTCLQNGRQTVWRTKTTVVSDFTWIASRDNDKMKCTCQSLHLRGQSSVSVSINVLFPPSLPEIYIHSNYGSWQNVYSEIHIKENNSLILKCSSESNPIFTFSWTGPKSSNNETLKLNVTNDSTEGSYACSATNVMTQTNGTSLEGMKNNSIRVNVLYPPSDIVITIRNQSTAISVSRIVNVLENISYILKCSARGKPEPKYSWTGPVNVTSDFLNFTSINRSMAGHYTCIAKNTMNESTGNIYNGQDNKTIYLNIQYASEVTEFFVAGHRENISVITNQKENATFHCNVDSNPSSAIGLQFKDKRLHFVNHTDTRNLTYFIRNLTCRDAGIYYCYSSNKINYGKRSMKQLTFIVKCPPLPEKDLNVNVTTLKYVSATLRFKAMDYLDSNITTFTWQRENNASQWETVKHDIKSVNVSTFNMQTNLTVVNVTEHYSGNYRVVYNNSVGGNTQIFQLSVADLPDTPTYFDYLKDSLTSTQVTVVWTKGYGGGLRQTFVLNISQRSQPIKYDYINETKNEDMQHTITGLSSGTQYKLTLWATNVLGKSSSQTLTILTKESETKETSSLTAAIAGSVSSLIAISAGVSVAFLLYKRRYQKKTDRSNGERSFDDGSEMNAQSGRNNPVKREPVYEGLKAINERGDVEMKEQTYDILKYKQDSSETKDPVYTNLKL